MYDSIIIEHPTRGVLKSWDGDVISGIDFHFSISGLRGNPEHSYQFESVRSAAIVWALMPTKLQCVCQILAREAGKPDYKPVV